MRKVLMYLKSFKYVMYLTITMTKQFFRFHKFSTIKNDLIGPTKANNHE